MRGSGELEVSVGGKVDSLGCNCVKVVGDVGRGGCCKPVYCKAYIVDASFGWFSICLGNASEGVSVSCV